MAASTAVAKFDVDARELETLDGGVLRREGIEPRCDGDGVLEALADAWVCLGLAVAHRRPATEEPESLYKSKCGGGWAGLLPIRSF